jgi:hypothetical protein
MSSFPRSKYVQNVYTDDDDGIKKGSIVSLLSNLAISEGSEWPMLQPGMNTFNVLTDSGVQNWELQYYERYGGL